MSLHPRSLKGGAFVLKLGLVFMKEAHQLRCAFFHCVGLHFELEHRAGIEHDRFL